MTSNGSSCAEGLVKSASSYIADSLVTIVYIGATGSGDSRMKKVGRALRVQGICRGGQHKYLPCMV